MFLSQLKRMITTTIHSGTVVCVLDCCRFVLPRPFVAPVPEPLRESPCIKIIKCRCSHFPFFPPSFRYLEDLVVDGATSLCSDP